MIFESYKGIRFVRIAALPEQEQSLIRKTLDETKIIKILRGTELLNDCVQTHHYQEWKGAASPVSEPSTATSQQIQELKLAFK